MTNPYTPRLPTMICRPHRRKLHTRLWLRYFFFFILVATLFLDSFLTIYSHRRPTRTQPSSLYDGIQQTSAANETSREGKPEKLFIAALHHNDAKLIRSHWGPTILDLVRHFGAENIYISIVESGSHDDTKAALSELDSQLKKLGISRNIEVLETTHKDEIERDRKVGEQRWVWAEIDGERRSARRRVTWLAEWRNKVMEPLTLLNDKGKIFDKVVWVNDVVFSLDDLLTLLTTRNGSYSTACALDFSVPHLYYDSFALRDIQGNPTISLRWPYFLSPISRKAVMS